MKRKFLVTDFDEIQNKKSLWPKDSTHMIFKEIWKNAISSTDVHEKYFVDKFLNLYTKEVQKILTLHPVNFISVD